VHGPRPISLAPGNGGRAMDGQPVIYSGSPNIEGTWMGFLGISGKYDEGLYQLIIMKITPI